MSQMQRHCYGKSRRTLEQNFAGPVDIADPQLIVQSHLMQSLESYFIISVYYMQCIYTHKTNN